MSASKAIACGIVALSLAMPSRAIAAQCKTVHKLTTPCTGRLIPNSLYLLLWTTHTVEVPKLEAELLAERELRASEERTCRKRLASCDIEVREVEVIVEKRVEVAMPPPVGEYILVGGVALMVGVVVGILVGKFAL